MVIRAAELTMDGFRDVTRRADTLLLPIGSIEAHGHHLPLGTDALIPEKMGEMAGQLLGERVILAPTIPYGHSWDLSIFPGTVNVSAEVFSAYVADVGLSYLNWGLTNILFLNGHGGNIPALSMAAERLAAKGARVLTISWWVDFSAEIKTITGGQGHAGEDESSVVLAIRSDLVDMSKARDYGKRLLGNVKMERVASLSYPDALSGRATLATGEQGEAILSLAARRIEEMVRALWAGDLLR
ncbi:MAG: creatininase family protein [Firmicutes bacterium]|nr:creatininase family protein [Bacillota bacterium]MCL5039806.1 creatininase family protein [Bacillota bacterium]